MDRDLAERVARAQPTKALSLGNGRIYWPDFWIPSLRRHLEVKGGESWETRERAVNPKREPNIRAAKRYGVLVDLLVIKYPLPDLARAQEARTVDGRLLREVLTALLGLSPADNART